MKNIYRIIVLSVITTLIIVGCSSKGSEPNKPNKQDIVQTEDDTEEDTNQEKEDKTVKSGNGIKSKVLRDIINAKTYTMNLNQTIKSNDIETVTLVTNVVADDQTYTHSETNGSILEHIEKDDKSYLIMHESENIIVSSRYDEGDPNDANNTLVYDDLEYVSSGKEMFLGSNYNFEEYEVELGVVKYYLDGKNLVGMEMIFDMDKIHEDEDIDEEDQDDEDFGIVDATMIVEVTSYEQTADMSVFELPEEYKQVGPGA